jgi:HK97 family phage prohead protease
MTITVAKDAGPALTRHITLLKAKSTESTDGERWITAWASTPDADLGGDVVLPSGAIFELPIPLLAYHKSDAPVGVVTEAHVSERGIRVKARLSKGVRLADEIWQLVRDGAIAAVSVGFVALKSKPLPSGGMLFESWRWIELSLTPTPMNPNARIVSVGKSIAYPDERAPKEPERLPQYIPCGDVVEDFKRAAASLPESARKHVSELRSGRTGRTWTMRDENGAEIATVSPQTTKQADKPKAAPSMKYITEKQMERFAAQLGASLGGLIADTIRPLAERIAALEKQRDELLSEIERRSWKYKGYWEADKSYRLNDVVTDSGCSWLALCDTKERPNFSSNSWRVIAKKGRDA